MSPLAYTTESDDWWLLMCYQHPTGTHDDWWYGGFTCQGGGKHYMVYCTDYFAVHVCGYCKHRMTVR